MVHQKPKGVFDIIPHPPAEGDRWRDSAIWQYVEGIARQVCDTYGLEELRTPCFERTELFQRSVGKTSDIVSKEMYTFKDRAGRSLSLRPEGTASALRAFCEEIVKQARPLYKLFYIGPMFRYERQQAGRYRQHHQLGVELIGDPSPERDAEVIDLLMTFYGELGLKNLTLQLNSLGDTASRERFRTALVAYLEPHADKLSEESQTRLEVNPLRILDSKAPQDREIVASAPSIQESLSEESRAHHEAVKCHLDALAIRYEEIPTLVRGLDYYNHTVFEVVAGELGAQNSIGAGGRYDGLIHHLGGPDLPALGFGTGLERVIQTLLGQQAPLPERPHPRLLLIPLGEAARRRCFQLLKELRAAKIPSEIELRGKKLKAAFRFAEQLGAEQVAVIGDAELEDQQCELKQMATRETRVIAFRDFVKTFLE